MPLGKKEKKYMNGQFFLLENSCFTTLCFLLYNEVNQLYVHI